MFRTIVASTLLTLATGALAQTQDEAPPADSTVTADAAANADASVSQPATADVQATPQVEPAPAPVAQADAKPKKAKKTRRRGPCTPGIGKRC